MPSWFKQTVQGIGGAIAIVISGLAGSHGAALALLLSGSPTVIAQEADSLCPSPALARVQTHTVAAGETLETIAADYNLLPVTLLGMNPAAQQGAVTPGMTLRIPPFNGIEVSVPSGQTWQDLATTYRMQADVLFEVNGCPAAVPDRIFVPGVSWFAGIDSRSPEAATTDADPLTGYPLPAVTTILRNYGWQSHPERDELVFSSGVTLAAAPETAVLAVGNGTVAYVGEQEAMATLIVINHAQGLQTRYAQVTNPQVKPGDQIRAGQPIAATLPSAESAAVLYFEVRSNSELGWVARDPGDYIPALAVR